MEIWPLEKIKWDFFHAVAMSELVYGCTTRNLTMCLENKLDGNDTKILHAVLNKFLKQQFIKQLLNGHLLPISQTIQVKQARHAG